MGASGLMLVLALAHDLRERWYEHSKMPASSAQSPSGRLAAPTSAASETPWPSTSTSRLGSAVKRVSRVIERTVSEGATETPPITWFWIEKANAQSVARGSQWLHEDAILADVEIVEQDMRAWCVPFAFICLSESLSICRHVFRYAYAHVCVHVCSSL